MNAIAVRLRPDQDLKETLVELVQQQNIAAGCVLTCAGSLKRATLRLADQTEGTRYDGKFEIVSLSGTLSPDGCHFHLALADEDGRVIGGHLLPGCIVHTTAEIVIGLLPHLRFRREPDPATGYDELVVLPFQAEDGGVV
jgi:hypothetical protein